MISSDMHCWVEGATLAIGFFHCGAPNDCWRGNCSATMPICRCCPSVLNSAIMMHIWIFLQYAPTSLVLLQSPNLPQELVTLGWMRWHVLQVHNAEISFLHFRWLILMQNQEPKYTEVPLQCNTSSYIIIKIPPALRYKLNLINHFLP